MRWGGGGGGRGNLAMDIISLEIIFMVETSFAFSVNFYCKINFEQITYSEKFESDYCLFDPVNFLIATNLEFLGL